MTSTQYHDALIRSLPGWAYRASHSSPIIHKVLCEMNARQLPVQDAPWMIAQALHEENAALLEQCVKLASMQTQITIPLSGGSL